MSRKVIIVGDGMVGKSALLQAFVHGVFHETYIPTVFETTAMDVEVGGGRNVTLGLWDTGGQEEFDQIRQLAYPGVRVILLCYAVDSLTSLSNVVHTWSPEVRRFCPQVPVLLVGCKSDLRGLERSRLRLVDPKEAAEVQKRIEARIHIECSAKTLSNVYTVFQLAAECALEGKEGQVSRSSQRGAQTCEIV
ncbi:Transforming protein RhoA [Echinococcus granulosus]|uniref:Transforming protein RhoA n=1 Tax=Echinococcus granulosus TaxID=6210 RepID=W6UDS9_ECHGR|nr:Transforming protein RhoA [Echinococcus granulosus]EUB59193.1 Transforming protein RhoA [Echinococcus granulosus]